MEFSKEAVRRFLINKQGFSKNKGKGGTLEALKQLECVQVDPISVVYPNQHLVLHNRVVDYKPSYLNELLYKDRLVFEYWCNEKSIIPIEDLPCFLYRMRNPSQFHSPFYERIKAQRRQLKEQIHHILSEIEKRGPLSVREFDREGKVEGKVATRVLNLLWDCGDLMVHHVDGNRRYYDLLARMFPRDTDEESSSREEYERFMIQKYMRAYGLIDTRDWRFGWLPLKASQRQRTVGEMVEDDMLHPITIQGVKHVYYVLDSDLSLLENAEAPIGTGIHFLAPLDNLLWNRRMISEIFDFSYSWEVYKVPEKRIYGYYVMPILHGTRFIGRLDPKLDRQGQKMILNSLVLEERNVDKNLIIELAVALERFLSLHEVSQVSIAKAQPKILAEALKSKHSARG